MVGALRGLPYRRVEALEEIGFRNLTIPRFRVGFIPPQKLWSCENCYDGSNIRDGGHCVNLLENIQHFRDGFEGYRNGTGFHGRVGFGERPAVLVVDMNLASTIPEAPSGTDMSSCIDAINQVLAVARSIRAPRIFTTMAYEPHLMDMGLPRRLKRSNNPPDQLIDAEGRLSKPAQLDRRLDFDPQQDMFFVKKHSSCFFGTPLLGALVSEQIDTIVLTGCSTTGCIRATAIDALAHGYRIIVPLAAVADRLEAQGPEGQALVAADLVQIDAKYGDVEPLDTVLEHLKQSESRVAKGQ